MLTIQINIYIKNNPFKIRDLQFRVMQLLPCLKFF